MSPVSGRRLWGTAGGLSYRGVTGQSPVPKKDLKKFLKILTFILILMSQANRSLRFARDASHMFCPPSQKKLPRLNLQNSLSIPPYYLNFPKNHKKHYLARLLQYFLLWREKSPELTEKDTKKCVKVTSY
jgi:hypothetical protein